MIIRIEQNKGSPWAEFPKPKSFFEKMEKWKSGLESDVDSFEGEQKEKLQALIEKIEGLCEPRRNRYAHYDFTRKEVQDLLKITSEAHSAFGGKSSDIVPPDVDAPRPFEGASLLRSVEAAADCSTCLSMWKH